MESKTLCSKKTGRLKPHKKAFELNWVVTLHMHDFFGGDGAMNW